MAPISTDPTKITDRVEPPGETTPLLGVPEHITSPGSPDDALESKANGHATTTGHDGRDEPESPPMPYAQILLLCFCSISEPVAYFSIFPYINEMLARTGGVPETDVGFWSGMIESLFSVVQMVLMIFYGRAADRLGRKPVLVFSLTGIAFATAGFGMARSLESMIVLRCTAGIFAGSVVTVRTMLSELTTKETQSKAFGWYMFTKNLGIFVGPLIGGGLANPAEQFPKLFARVPFWEDYPYALSSYAAGAVVLCSAISSLFLKETLKRKVEGQPAPETLLSTWEVLKSPGVPMVMYIYGHVMLLSLMYTAMNPVFMFTRVKLGGFGFSDQKIALFIALAGASQALWLLLFFPPLQKNFGTGTVLRACSSGWPIFMAAYPVMNEFLRHGWTLTFWIVAPIGVVLGSGVAMSFAAVQLCINDISPSATVLGTMNALSLTITSGIRAFAPVLSTSIFASGVKWGFADGHLAWLVLIAVSLPLNFVVWFYLPEGAEGRPKKANESEDDGAVR